MTRRRIRFRYRNRNRNRYHDLYLYAYVYLYLPQDWRIGCIFARKKAKMPRQIAKLGFR
jgi:hypothetical protein